MESSWQVEKEPFCLKVLKTRFPNAERAADILTCRGLTSSVPASHARIGRSRERERDCLERAAASFTSLRESCMSFDPLGSSSRMFPDFSVVTTDETLRKSSGFSWSSAGMGFNGVCLTASFSESPRDAVVCSLSDVLESHAPQRFFLSQKAAEGILRRAKKRGRTLPERLMTALQVLTGQTHQAKPCASMSEQPTPCGAAPTDTQPSLTSGENRTAITDDQAHAGMDATTSYWDDSQTTDTLDCSMLAKGQMMPEKRRFPAVLTQAETTADSEPNRENILSVRRLTPTECEVLQGFPKGWTLPDTALLETPSPSTSFAGSDEELCGTEVSA